MASHDHYPAHSHSEEVPEQQVSIAHVLAVLRRYRLEIVAALVAIFVGYALLAIVVFLFSPSKQVTTLPFRLVFEGADAGRYPNGMDFNTTEITATPVLQKVYSANGLQQFVGFADLKSSIFVIEQNKDLDRLALEYNAKLADPRISPVDRERLEKEYDLRKGSIRRTDYALTFVVDDRTRALPEPLRIQVLKSVLDTWAQQAMDERGAGRYRIPVLSRNILRPNSGLEGQDYAVAIDVLRTKANRIISTIDQLLTVPGAEVLATGKERITLPEVRVNLEDTRRFRLEPMMAMIRLHHLSKNFRTSLDFLQSQLDSARRRRDQEKARVATLQRSLDSYMQRNTATVGEGQASRSGVGGTQVIPQIDKSFLDQLSDLIAQKRDVDYRQRLVDNLNSAAIGQLLPAENEVAYYETLVQSMKTPASPGAAAPEMRQTVESEYGKSADEIYRAVDQVSSIYQLMSRNLNPGLVVYSLIGTVDQASIRSVSLGRLMAYGILLMIIAVPLVLLAALLHNRIREEEQSEESRHRLMAAEP